MERKVFVIVGAPCSGKTTMMQTLSKYLEGESFSVIETGEIFRNDEKLREITARGELVDDQTVIEIFKKEMEKAEGIIFLNGYPRTKKQVKVLEEMNNYDFTFLKLEANIENIRKRVSGRRICPKCNETYNLLHVDSRPKVENHCDKCGAELIIREDDKLIEKRLEKFTEETEPAILYAMTKFNFHIVDSEKIFESEYMENLVQDLGI